MNDDIRKKLEKWVKENYNSGATSYTVERSRGNCDDCFYDGEERGISWAAYEVGCILGMELEEPLQCDEDE